MCVAAPGKVIKIENETAVVDYSGNRIKAHCGLVNVKPGDCVLVHAGLIIQVISENEAIEMRELFKELEELSNG